MADSTQTTGTRWSTLNHSFLVNGGTNTHTQIDNHIVASQVHGLTGNVVGSNYAQTLTNKTITSTNTIRCTAIGTTSNNVSINQSTASLGNILKATTNSNASWGTVTATVPGITSDVMYNDGTIDNTSKISIDTDGYTICDDHNTTPSVSSIGCKLFAIHKAGRYMLSQKCMSGVNYSFQPTFASNKIGWWTAQGNSTTISAINIGTTTSGSATSRNIATTNLFTSMGRLGYVSSNPGGSSAGTCHGALQFWRGNASNLGGFYYVARFGFTSNKSDQRTFVGFANTATTLTNTNPSTNTNILGFGADDTDTSIYFMHNDNVGTATKDTLTGTFPSQSSSSDMYEIRIFCPPNGSTVYYSIENLSQNSFYENSITSDIPSNTTLLCPQIWINNGGTAGVVGVDVVSQYIETDN